MRKVQQFMFWMFWMACYSASSKQNATAKPNSTCSRAPNVTRHPVTPVTAPRSLFDMWCRFPCPSLGCAAMRRIPHGFGSSFDSRLWFRATGRERCSGQSGPKWHRISSRDKLGQVWKQKAGTGSGHSMIVCILWYSMIFHELRCDSCYHGRHFIHHV